MSSNDESTADDPQRIDLTQFEGMTKGPWRIPEHAAEIVDSEDYAVLWVDFSGESPAEYMFRNSALHCANKEDIEAMAKVPELIAELKRCYDRIDYLEVLAEEYRQERPEEYCANCYAYLEDYDGDGVMECLCRDCEASQ